MSNIIPFEFEGVPVRVVDQNGDPWWVLLDLCRVLDIGNSSDAASRLDSDVKCEVGITDPTGRVQQTTIISEGGLYDLLDRSRKPAAKRFRRWKNHEVMPTLRKTGRYVMPGAEDALEATIERAWNKQAALIGAQFATTGAALVRIESKVDHHSAQIEELNRRIKPPKEPFDANDFEIWRQTIYVAYQGREPILGLRMLLDEDGNWLPGKVGEHWNREKGGYKNGIPTFQDINEKLKDQNFRDSKAHRFKSFQDEVDRLFPNGPRSWLGREATKNGKRKASPTITCAAQSSWIA